MWKPMVRSRDSEAVPETRGAPVDRQRQILIRHYNRTGYSCDGLPSSILPILGFLGLSVGVKSRHATNRQTDGHHTAVQLIMTLPFPWESILKATFAYCCYSNRCCYMQKKRVPKFAQYSFSVNFCRRPTIRAEYEYTIRPTSRTEQNTIRIFVTGLEETERHQHH